ncbi:DHHC palmitoyltransferase-domain-containing protein [Bombardia bombarda]|uniref:Palmitoyltransferase n=1 Tax=Bombardia bombarda TaxID=252184 RepID=A0AA40C8L7_9PEZI|nr:DHHC palmitoyltransferase-domain-containing protein [Bombardia bombarda]
MGVIATIALVILGISFMTFVTFFGRLPALRRTPIAWLHRLIWVYLPNGILAVDQRLTSGRVTSSLSRFGNFVMYDKHPTVLIFFFLLLSVGETLYLPSVWPVLPAFQKLTGALAIILPYIFLYLSAFTDPGTIAPLNHTAEMARYPYDFTLFHPGATCATCRLLKPARSKHCSVCKRCVARADHHCIFINNCVGAHNQRWFVLLLLTTAVLTLYGGVLGMHLLVAKMKARYPLWTLLPWRADGGRGMELRDWLIVWSWGLQDQVAMGSVTLLALLTSPLVWGLLGYHVWLIYCGTTTNESMKWSDWQAEMDDGFAFRRKMAAGRVKDLSAEPAWTRWPVETEQILVRTEDGKVPRPGRLEVAGEGEWEPVWRLKDVENMYDIGFWDNLVDVFAPGHVFRDPLVPAAEGSDRRKKRSKKFRR